MLALVGIRFSGENNSLKTSKLGNQKRVAKELNLILADVLPNGAKADLDLGDWEQLLSDAISVIRSEYDQGYDAGLFSHKRRQMFEDCYEFVRSDFGNLGWLCRQDYVSENRYPNGRRSEEIQMDSTPIVLSGRMIEIDLSDEHT